MAKERDEVKAMFEAAHRDPQLKQRLLAEPENVAKEWNVTLNKEEVGRLQQLGAFIDMMDEVQNGSLYERCDPRVCYPVTVWQRQRVFELLRDYRYIVDWKNPIFYPAPDFSRITELGIESRLGLRRR